MTLFMEEIWLTDLEHIKSCMLSIYGIFMDIPPYPSHISLHQTSQVLYLAFPYNIRRGPPRFGPTPDRKAPVVRRPTPCNTSAVVKAMPLVFPAHVKALGAFVVDFFYRKGGWGRFRKIKLREFNPITNSMENKLREFNPIIK